MSREIHIPTPIRDDLARLSTGNVECSGFLLANEPDYCASEDQYVSTMVVADRGDLTSTRPSDEAQQAIDKAVENSSFQAHYFHTHPDKALEHPNVERSDILDYSEADLEAFRHGQKKYEDPDHWEMIVSSLPDEGFNFQLIASAQHELKWTNWRVDEDRTWQEVGTERYETLEDFGFEEAPNPL